MLGLELPDHSLGHAVEDDDDLVGVIFSVAKNRRVTARSTTS